MPKPHALPVKYKGLSGSEVSELVNVLTKKGVKVAGRFFDHDAIKPLYHVSQLNGEWN